MILWRKPAEDRDLLLKSWALILSRPPVTVTMDLLYGSFCAKDRSEDCVYADDLSRERFDEIVSVWAEILCPGDAAAFQGRFCLREIERQITAGKTEIHLATGQPPGRILVRAALVAGLGEAFVEFSFRSS